MLTAIEQRLVAATGDDVAVVQASTRSRVDLGLRLPEEVTDLLRQADAANR
jgi:hypothetical protein